MRARVVRQGYDKGGVAHRALRSSERLRRHFAQKPAGFAAEYEYRFVVISDRLRWQLGSGPVRAHQVELGHPIDHAEPIRLDEVTGD